MMTVAIVGISVTLLIALLGWAYQLGRSDARLSRTERDIEDIKRNREACSREHDKFESDLRKDISEQFGRLFDKIDELPCHNPGWNREACK